MKRPIPAIWLFLATTLGLGALACEPGGVGDPCTPEDEYQTTFGGYDEAEVNVESRSFQCETRLCLVNHFRGRVSCPYGQTEEDLKLPPTDPKRCRVPGTSGANQGDSIDVAVPAQLVSRSAAASPEHGDTKDAVYCSCRCDGPDPNARYCECPSGFTCEKLIDDLGLGSAQLAGSYCIKNGTNYDSNNACGNTCDPTTQKCD